MAYCLTPKMSDFYGYPFVSYTYTRTETFQKNNCSSGQIGSFVSYSKTYNSSISESDAYNKAFSDTNFNSEAQANANANGTCSISCIIPTANRSWFAGISSTEIWLRAIDPPVFDSTEGRIVSSIPRASFDAGTSFSGSGPVLHNASYLVMPYPHQNPGLLVSIQDHGSTFDLVYYAGNNACSSYNLLKSNLNKNDADTNIEFYEYFSYPSGVSVLNDSLIYVLRRFRDIQFWYSDVGTSSSRKIFQAYIPDLNGGYNLTFARLVTTPINAITYILFNSNRKSDSKRTRTALYGITRNQLDASPTVTTLLDWNYNSRQLEFLSAGAFGEYYMFLYSIDQVGDRYVDLDIITNAPTTLPTYVSQNVDSTAIISMIGDSDNLYIIYSNQISVRRVARYKISTNSWTQLF